VLGRAAEMEDMSGNCRLFDGSFSFYWHGAERRILYLIGKKREINGLGTTTARRTRQV
jgi:hypothetical protein